ncbi:hypothetical protein BKA70DRAFT_1251419 [Coprinopsis sp. MPI-PUGE-AT-0042]|nr:hypothetical protein BKA70DRAFT_1251419 [Coprinopsis sp. MPI-PUGE-AT-0042]
MRFFLILAAAGLAFGRPMPKGIYRRQAEFALQNGQDAIAANQRFATLNADSPCQEGENACVNDGFAQCVGGRFVIQPCAGGTICAALPLVNSRGTSNTCTTAADRDARIAATGATGAGAAPPPANNGGNNGGNNNDNGGNNNNNNQPPAQAPPAGNNNNADAQTSLTLDPAVIAQNFANDGQAEPSAGQVASLTSSNNFINFCKTVNKPLTNGNQVVDGSCNPAPMGVIAARNRMPTSKFEFPANGGTVPANQAFTIRMNIQNLETGFFVNAQQNYFSAPQQVNAQGIIQGHSHVVIQKLESLDQTTVLDPERFEFFKGLNAPAAGGSLTAEVTNGLAPGVYKLSSINSAANHQPVLVAVAQHGALDDTVYFTVA